MIYKHDYQRMALDTDRMMITQCGNDYHDYSDNKLACIYIKWAEEHCPERLQAETDKGRIYVHIDERITECEKEKWKIWNKMRATDPEYALAMKNADTAKVWQLENLFELQAEEIAIQMCLLVQYEKERLTDSKVIRSFFQSEYKCCSHEYKDNTGMGNSFSNYL